MELRNLCKFLLLPLSTNWGVPTNGDHSRKAVRHGFHEWFLWIHHVFGMLENVLSILMWFAYSCSFRALIFSFRVYARPTTKAIASTLLGFCMW